MTPLAARWTVNRRASRLAVCLVAIAGGIVILKAIDWLARPRRSQDLARVWLGVTVWPALQIEDVAVPLSKTKGRIRLVVRRLAAGLMGLASGVALTALRQRVGIPDQGFLADSNRAIAGLSMGGGQPLNFGLGHLDHFAWVGGFSSAPNTRAPEKLVPNPAEAAQGLKLLWISCDDRDGLINISQRVHAYLKERKVPHIWHLDSGGHSWPVWKNDLYLFSQQLFRS